MVKEGDQRPGLGKVGPVALAHSLDAQVRLPDARRAEEVFVFVAIALLQ